MKIKILLIIVFIVILHSCKDIKEEYYQRPSWLEPPIYQILEKRGNFKIYLSCVDKAGFKKNLSGAGFYTVFAPTDSAFNEFFKKYNYNSIDELPIELIKGIVGYSIIQNAYTKEKIDDFQSSRDTTMAKNRAFKRKTFYFKGVYKDTINNDVYNVIDQNYVLPETSPSKSMLYAEDNNYKCIPYFTSDFLKTLNLSAYDYNYFYPYVNFSGFNVVDAKIKEADILAENGVIHIVDKVILPLPNLEEIFKNKPQYSLFRDIVYKYMLSLSEVSEAVQLRYKNYFGINEKIYVKFFPYLNFSPACENYLRFGGGETHDYQKGGWTLFVPTNEALQEFFNTKFLTYYKSLDNMSTELIGDFLNVHFFRTIVWPSKFDKTFNANGEPARFNPETDVVEKIIASNGIFYGVNKIQESDLFYSVYGEILLNPEYQLMLQAIKSLDLHYILINPNFKFTVILISNNQFQSIGFSYDAARNTWSLNNPALGNNASLALTRVINLHIIPNKVIENINDYQMIKTYGGEYIRVNAGRAVAAGNSLRNPPYITLRNMKQAKNGITYTILQPTEALLFSNYNVGYDIKRVFGATKYYKYLEKSYLYSPGYIYDTVKMTIANVQSTDNNTILIPTDAAIDSAVAQGYLPPLPQYGTFTNDDDVKKVYDFVMYHIIAKSCVVQDPTEEGVRGKVETYYRTPEGKTYMYVINDAADFYFMDDYNRIIRLVSDITKYNILSNRCIIHQINGFLKYKK